MSLFTTGWPFSYVFLCLAFFLGICLTTLIFGLIVTVILLVCIYTGIIRISPILEGITAFLEYCNPSGMQSIKDNIRKSFLVEQPDGKLNERNHIFLFHPHGAFSIANALHIGTDFTNWPIRKIKGTILSWFLWLPFAKEIIEKMNFVPSNYDDMKNVLEAGESLTLCLGGVREILETEPCGMRLSIKKRRGIFRIALQQGTPIVPVISYGENEVFELIDTPLLSWIQSKLIHYGICAPIPTLESCRKWYGILNAPLKEPIRTIIGTAIEVEAHEPTEQEIDDLREKYFIALRDLYERTRPESYTKDLEII